MIQVEQLVKRFGPKVAVNRISFQVERGEVLGFLGPNGAGKSTTMKMITCYLKPDSGTAKVGGFDINTHSFLSLDENDEIDELDEIDKFW